MPLFILFYCLVMAVGTVMCTIKSEANAGKLKTKIMHYSFSILFILFTILSIWLLFNVDSSSATVAKKCGICDGSGTISGKKCIICGGSGGAILTQTHYKIHWMYPFATGILAFGFFISAAICVEPHYTSTYKSNTDTIQEPIFINVIKVKPLHPTAIEGTVGLFSINFVFTNEETNEILGRGKQFDVITLNVDKPTKIRCHVDRDFSDAILDYSPRQNAMYYVVPDTETNSLYFKRTDSFE